MPRELLLVWWIWWRCSLLFPTVEGKDICSLEWNSDHSTTVKVDTAGESNLRIKHAGYYYVYSQVTFSASGSIPLENIIRHIRWKPVDSNSRHRLSPQPEAKDEILLKSYCAPGQKPLCTASQGGVFRLEKDDELYVQVTDVSWVNYDWNATFFGLYKL